MGSNFADRNRTKLNATYEKIVFHHPASLRMGHLRTGIYPSKGAQVASSRFWAPFAPSPKVLTGFALEGLGAELRVFGLDLLPGV